MKKLPREERLRRRSEYMKGWRMRNALKKKAYDREWALDNKEKRRVHRRTWLMNHPEERKLSDRRYYLANLERVKSYQKGMIEQLKREIHTILGSKCAYCGLNDTRTLQIDHRDNSGARERKLIGGGCTFYRHCLSQIKAGSTNYQLLCANCNWIKEAQRRALSGGGLHRRSAHSRKTRTILLELLGNRCARCGLDDTRCLHVDHLNNNGYREREEGGCGSGRLLARVKAGSNGYQLLCANCNWIKRIEHLGTHFGDRRPIP